MLDTCPVHVCESNANLDKMSASCLFSISRSHSIASPLYLSFYLMKFRLVRVSAGEPERRYAIF